MLKLLVVDSSAESRNRIVTHITAVTRSDTPDIALLPQFSIKALSFEELKFHAAPDILIVGDELIAHDLSCIGHIRKTFATTPILVRISSAQARLSVIEHIARLGGDDVWSSDATPQEFLRKLVLLSRKVQKQRSGKLVVVDGGKGGVGVTSLCAGLADALVAAGKKVLVIDMDTQTQDLSRFLQARPFINENLQLLLDQSRPITQESVEQTLSLIWQDEPAFMCMPPLAESDSFVDPRGVAPRLFLQILEVVDTLFDCVIVDVASTQGALLRTLYRVADRLLFVMNGDPASMYASVDRFSRLRSGSAPDARLLVVENASLHAGLSHAALREEFFRVARISPEEWFEGGIPFSRPGSRWPASGATLYSRGSGPLAHTLHALAVLLELVEDTQRSKEQRTTLWGRIRTFLARSSQGAVQQKLPPLQAHLPALTSASSTTPGRGTLLPQTTVSRSEQTPHDSSPRAPLLQLKPARSSTPVDGAERKLDPKKLVSGATFS